MKVIQHNEFVLVEVKKGAHNFGFVPYGKDKWSLYYDDQYGHDGSCEPMLPPGNYTIIGLAKDLDDWEWNKISPEKIIRNHQTGMTGVFFERFDKEPFDGAIQYCRTATESGLSLLRSHGLTENTLIIKKV